MQDKRTTLNEAVSPADVSAADVPPTTSKKTFFRNIDEWEKPIAVVKSLLVAFLIVLACSYFESMNDLKPLVEKGGNLYALCGLFYLMPPYVSFVAIPIIPFIYLTRRRFEKRQIPILVVSIVIALCIVTSQSLVHTHSYGPLFSCALNGVLTIISLLGISALIFYLLRPAFYVLLDFCERWDHKDFRLKPAHYAIIFFIFVVSWSIYIIGFAPGFINIDGVRQLGMWEGFIPASIASPPITTIVYGFIFSLGQMIGGDKAGLFAIVIMQTLCLSATFTFEVKVFEKLQAPKWAVITLIIMVAASPIIGAFCAFCAMDNLHAAFFAVYVSLFILYLKDPKTFSRSIPWMAALMIAALMAAITRHNAVYAVAFTLPFLALFHPGIKRKLIAVVPLVATLVLMPCVTQVCVSFLGIQNSLSATSALSLMVQQSARYAVEHPDDYEDWEYTAIDNKLRMDDLAERYQYWLQDPVGFEANPDADQGEYVRAWASQGLRHPLTYLDATGEMTYGWWSLQTTVPYELEGNRIGQANLINDDTGKGVFDFGYWSKYSFRESVNRFAEIMEQMPFGRYLLQGGFYTWMFMIMAAFLVFAKRSRYILMLIPSTLILVTLFFGPRDNTVRYFFDVICSFPVMLWATIYFAGHRYSYPTDKVNAVSPHEVEKLVEGEAEHGADQAASDPAGGDPVGGTLTGDDPAGKNPTDSDPTTVAACKDNDDRSPSPATTTATTAP